ncbi:MAG: hypothetical protein KatS3mg038_1658 [Candidatus Kapaibacterium sp.]|nr:MAG: hypothetical protein KatS3mg038_1658 [Candidatus Kapabacteria bacterium]
MRPPFWVSPPGVLRGRCGPKRPVASTHGRATQPHQRVSCSNLLCSRGRARSCGADMIWSSSLAGAAPIDGTPILTHPDAIAAPGDLPVEAKTTGIVGPVSGDWGEDGTDEVPEYYLVQLAVQAAALGADRGFVSALIGGSGFRLYEVAIPSTVRDALVERLCDWWQYHVVGDRPPADEPPPLDVVSRLKRTAWSDRPCLAAH